jgi:predicted DNA-binding transcriptional regulator AlpA
MVGMKSPAHFSTDEPKKGREMTSHSDKPSKQLALAPALSHQTPKVTQMSSPEGARKPATPIAVLLRPEEAAKFLKVSLSWVAKARVRGDGPPFIRIGRSIRYVEATLIQWTKSQQRLSTGDI